MVGEKCIFLNVLTEGREEFGEITYRKGDVAKTAKTRQKGWPKKDQTSAPMKMQQPCLCYCLSLSLILFLNKSAQIDLT